MFKVATVMQQIMTELNGAVSEEAKIVTITKKNCSKSNESPETTDFLLREVSTKIMTQTRDYAYYGTVDIDEDVCELLAASVYFCVPGIVQLCYDILKNNLNPENCIGVMLFARC
jgi:hypothetical protein